MSLPNDLPDNLLDNLEDNSGIERRFQRNTYIVIASAVIASLIWSSRRMTLGVALGGALSLFNKRWLMGSVKAILSAVAATQNSRVPPFTASKFILRYFIIAFIFIAADSTGDFHPLGIGIGLAAFVGGIMIEACYQLYLAFKSDNILEE